MPNSTAVFWVLGSVGAIAALYGLHRIALGMEDRGWVYYVRKSPKGGASNAFLALRELVEPGVARIEVVVRDARLGDESASPGGPDPDGSRSSEPAD